jgi:hypothetical protein
MLSDTLELAYGLVNTYSSIVVCGYSVLRYILFCC